jgi:hypothetical protein
VDFLENVGSQSLPVTAIEAFKSATASICRIDDRWGNGHGSGFVVRMSWFKRPEQLAILTNAHVVNRTGVDALTPREVYIQFPELRVRVKMEVVEEDLLFLQDGSQGLDYCLLTSDQELPEPSYEPRFGLVSHTSERVERVIPVGYPLGGKLRLSLFDSRLLSTDEKHLYYRSETNPGSSGGPLFNAGLFLIGIHQAGVVMNGTKTNRGLQFSSIYRHLVDGVRPPAAPVHGGLDIKGLAEVLFRIFGSIQRMKSFLALIGGGESILRGLNPQLDEAASVRQVLRLFSELGSLDQDFYQALQYEGGNRYRAELQRIAQTGGLVTVSW